MLKALRRMLLMTILMAALPLAAPAADGPRTAVQIRDEMRTIRRDTNWDDPRDSQQANERLRLLKRELEGLRVQRLAGQDGASAAAPDETVALPAANRATLSEQVEKTAAQGEGTILDLAAPLREDIAAEYLVLYNPEIKNQVLFNEATMLVIDFSQPAADIQIRQLEMYKAIHTLVLTGGKQGAPVHLAAVLDKARKLPLKTLYIVNFRTFLGTLPENIGNFTGLLKLGVYNNNLSTLPPAIGRLTALKTLYVDLNPLATLLPAVRPLGGLQELGIGKTRIGKAEIEELQHSMPDCRIVTQ